MMITEGDGDGRNPLSAAWRPGSSSAAGKTPKSQGYDERTSTALRTRHISSVDAINSQLLRSFGSPLASADEVSMLEIST